MAPRRKAASDAHGHDGAVEPYAPLNVLKLVARKVWVVDGPTVDMGSGPTRLCFPTRMTIVETDVGLFVHSPTPLTPELAVEVRSLGQPRWIIGPNRLHHTWLAPWRDAFADAEIYLAPRLHSQFGVGGSPLDREFGYPWDPWLRTLPVVGRYTTEVVFLHRASRTLILTDLIENFEEDRIRSRLMRLMVRIGGVMAPNGQMPRDMRLTFRRRDLRAAVEHMIAWNPERIIIAHGRWFPSDGARELRRAFAWLLR